MLAKVAQEVTGFLLDSFSPKSYIDRKSEGALAFICADHFYRYPRQLRYGNIFKTSANSSFVKAFKDVVLT